jgi:hypothetical protein
MTAAIVAWLLGVWAGSLAGAGSFEITELFYVFVLTLIVCSYLYDFVELLVTFWELSIFSPI